MSSPRSVSNASPSNAGGLERFFRRFFVKAAQVIVQSRQNDKVCTRSCGHPSSNEWFSLNINVSQSKTQKWKFYCCSSSLKNHRFF